MSNKPPPITGKQLIRLLRADGWLACGQRTHGIAFRKTDATGRSRITIIPDKRSLLPAGTLADILGPQQTCIRREGLVILVEKYGLK